MENEKTFIIIVPNDSSTDERNPNNTLVINEEELYGMLQNLTPCHEKCTQHIQRKTSTSQTDVVHKLDASTQTIKSEELANIPQQALQPRLTTNFILPLDFHFERRPQLHPTPTMEEEFQQKLLHYSLDEISDNQSLSEPDDEDFNNDPSQQYLKNESLSKIFQDQ